MKVLAIDESGRGPAIGPLVMCGYLIDEKKTQELRKMGVKDSKLLTAAKREELFPKLEKMAKDYALLQASAKDIDKLRSVSNLNKYEIKRMLELIEFFNPDKVIIDALEQEESFQKKIIDRVNGTTVIAENFADKKYPEVGAASILAKVTRDREIEKLHKLHGDFGSGYPADPLTIDFLKNWIKRNKDFPDCVRKSWMTVKMLKMEKEQKTLSQW